MYKFYQLVQREWLVLLLFLWLDSSLRWPSNMIPIKGFYWWQFSSSPLFILISQWVLSWWLSLFLYLKSNTFMRHLAVDLPETERSMRKKSVSKRHAASSYSCWLSNKLVFIEISPLANWFVSCENAASFLLHTY